MGFVLSRIISLLQRPRRPFDILMVGLDGAGKTTILYKIKLNEVVETMLTAGFNVESVEHKKIRLTVWDIGCNTNLRQLRKVYYKDKAAIIYVVDSGDESRIDEAKEDLDNMLGDKQLKGCPLLILANKQDLPRAKSPPWITNALNLQDMKRPWFVQGTSAVDSMGIYDALDWLEKMLLKKV